MELLLLGLLTLGFLGGSNSGSGSKKKNYKARERRNRARREREKYWEDANWWTLNR